MKKTAAFILAICATVVVSPASGQLIGLWRFDGTADDSSFNNNNGELLNGAGFSADTPNGGGMSLALAGGEQHVLIPHDDTLTIDDAISITAWVKTDNVGWDGILGKNPSDGSGDNHAGNYELRIENGSRGTHFLYQQGGDNDTAFHLNDLAVVPDATWTHVAVTAEREGDVSYYLDGTFVGVHDNLTTAGFGAPNTNPLYIGSRADLFTTMDGLLDDVAIFDVVLTEGQIAAIATGDFSAFLEPPSADFNGDGSVDTDDYFVLSDNLYRHLLGPVTPSDGDFDRNGSIDLVDFGLFKDQFPGVVAQALAIPEPASITLLFAATVGFLGLYRRRQS